MNIKVFPNAAKTQISDVQGDWLRIKIASAPVKGKANKELIKFLSHILGLSQDRLTIEKGLTSKRKVIAIYGLTQDQVMTQLEKH